MPTNQVLIISPNELFREGLRRILSRVPALTLAGIAATLAEVDAQKLVSDGEVNLILIEQNGNQAEQEQEISQLLGMPGERLRVIALSLEKMQMQNYQRQQISSTSVAQFLKAIEDG